jgi:TetR/AcrR family transcriptional regulator, regulator of autoinduction and epiphytic fitness
MCQVSPLVPAESESARSLEPDDRRRVTFEAALALFARYGYRKTSMHEIADAAGISRQGLYLHFRTKEVLFREMVAFFLANSLAQATSIFADPARPLRQQLVDGFDAWVGWYADALGGADVTELAGVAEKLVADLVTDHEQRFQAALVKCIRRSGLVAAHERSGLSARQLADVLYAAARGLKHEAPSRAAIAEGMRAAVAVMCAPLEDDR